jgi:phenylacetate-CoA ligase
MNPTRKNWPPLPREALEARQLCRLRGYLSRTVLPFSDHYGALFRGHSIDPRRLVRMEDLRVIPFTTKLEVAPNVRDFVLKPDQAVLKKRPSTIGRALLHGKAAVEEGFEREFRPILMTSTTGRSCDPVPFVYSQHDIQNLAWAGRRVMEICGATREMRMLNMFPFAPHLAFWITHYAGTEFGVFVVGTGGGKVMGTEGNLRLVRKIEPDVLIGMPTFIYHVLHEAAANGVTCPKLKKIVLGGEKAPVGMRRKLRNLARELGAEKVDVLPTYGFTEARMAWPQCPVPEDEEPSGYHLFPELGIIEVIDPASGEQVPEGEPGEIVFTPLDARGSVVLRYRTGDMVSGGLVHGRCPHCGRTGPRLMGAISRTSEVKEMQLEKLKGTLIDFNHLEHVLDDFEEIGTWQIELRKAHDDPLEVDELVLHVQPLSGADERRLRADLSRHFAAATEIHPNRIEFHTEEELRQLQGVGTQLKEQRVVDHRPAASESAAANEVFHTQP